MKKLLLSLLASLALTGGAFAQVFPSLFLAQMNGSGGAVRPAPASGGPASFSSITDTGLTAGRVVYTGTGGLLSANDQFTYDGTSTVAIGSTITNGLRLYNTVDQVTNYERLSERFTTNIALIGTETGTFATGRDLRLFSQASNNGAGYSTIKIGSAAPFLDLGCFTTLSGTTSFSTSSSGNLIRVTPPNATGGSGTVVAFALLPTYNQSASTAVNTDLLINRTETAVGSGAQFLADFQVGGATRFNVDNNGTASAIQDVSAGRNTKTSATGAVFWSARSLMRSPSDGVVTVSNQAETDFTRLQFGGTTTSFPALGRSGTNLTVTLADGSAGGGFAPSQTAGIIGTTTNNSANAGSVGEELKTTVASASAVSLTTATSTNLASVSLTAGDWDVYSEFIYIPGATTSVSQLSQGISQSTGALPTTTTGAGDYSVYSIVAAVLGANNISQSVGPVRVSLSGTTTVFAVARPTFTISTLTVYGSIRARRVR